MVPHRSRFLDGLTGLVNYLETVERGSLGRSSRLKIKLFGGRNMVKRNEELFEWY